MVRAPRPFTRAVSSVWSERFVDIEEVTGSNPVLPTNKGRRGYRFESCIAHMRFNILYEDENVLVIDKPAGMIVDDIPRRVHRLDKDTSGILLIAKNEKTLEFLQKQFQGRKVKKKYLALVVGHLKNEEGVIETLLSRSPKDRRKQKVYLPQEPKAKGRHPPATLRKAITEYKVLERFKNYTLVEAKPKTGRKHQIRTHFVYLGHPIAGDKLYGFKNQPLPKDLKRQFLHASYLKIKLPDGQEKEFKSDLPDDLKSVLNTLQIYGNKN